MSLFGDQDQAAARATSNLFDDGPSTPAKAASSSLFAASSANESAGWGFTSSRKSGGRRSLVKSLLADADVPDFYIETFDALQTAGSAKRDDCQRLLKSSAISIADQAKIWSIASGGADAQELGRDEFNVFLALIGLAKEGEELGLDAVDERRTKLPVPDLPGVQPKPMPQPAPTAPADVQSGAQASLERSRGNVRKPSFGAGFESDPWGSPEMHKGHKHVNGSGLGPRTTSTFTTTAPEPSDANGSYGDAPSTAVSNSGGSWGDTPAFAAAANTAGFGGASQGVAGGGFDEEGTRSSGPRRQPQSRPTTSKNDPDEIVTVSLLGEKEGMFMFQHRNYEVASTRRNSKVIRRYSDFVWLLDCLHKRYPFRQLPLLPPKRVAINGNHLVADNSFIEKRRRGLGRFANALVRHPVLKEEQLVVMFLTVPTEISVWRKQATVSVQEEFTGRPLTPGLEDSLPQNLSETFDTVRSGVRRSAELYINMCSLVERLCKRKEGIAAEYGRLNLNMVSVTEVTMDTYAIDQNDVPLLNEGINGTAKHIGTSQSLLEDEARAWDEGFLEDLKTTRDSLVSMRDMFDRRDRYSKDSIPQLERRIQQNEQKLQNIRAKGDAAKPGEAENVGNAITADKQSIVEQHARGVFIKECVKDEIHFFQSNQYRISRLHQDWAQERVKYAELQADNFRAMVDTVERMPLGD